MNRQLEDDIIESMPHLTLRMTYKLGVHAKKGPWRGVNINDAIIHLRQEILELITIIKENGTYEEVADECADCANMILIIMNNYGREHV